MRTYSIHCETCGDILEDGSPGTVAVYAVTHGSECTGEQEADSPLKQAYENYLATQTHEKQMDHLNERMKHTLRNTPVRQP